MRTDIEDIRVPQKIMAGNVVPNIFTRLPKFPKTVYVVAAGPNGVAAETRIAKDACTIACNSAVLYERQFNWIVMFDHRLVCCDFWETIHIPLTTKRLFGARLVNRLRLQAGKFRHITPDAYFEYVPNISCPTKLNPHFPITPPAQVLMPGVLRGGATVAGIAIQLAYYGGAQHIVLVGVDMFGTGHHNGFINPDPYKLCGADWPWAVALDNLCAAVIAKGVRISTASQSALKVPKLLKVLP
jgi:hypothetical protein